MTEEKNIPIPNNVNNMATITLKDALKVVPEFNGKNIPLGVFFEVCDEAKEMIGPANEANLTKLIRGKLSGEARTCIHGQTFNTLDALKDYLKTIYVPVQNVQQILGQMGNEYQKDNETVITFANRIRELLRRAIETQRVNAGGVTANFKNEIETTAIECFKNGLRPEIENKLENANDITNIVNNAIKAERFVEAQKKLRLKDQFIKQREVKRTHFCTICKDETHDAINCNRQTENKCSICNKLGHDTRDCRFKNNQITCQICNKNGHSAQTCYSLKTNNPSVICQICNKQGHAANICYHLPTQLNYKQNRFEAKNQLICQLCG